MIKLLALILPVGLLATACQQDGAAGLPGDSDDTQPYAGIAENAELRLIGTEPFWGATISAGTIVWTTPDNIEGTSAPVERFAGRGGVSFSGVIEGATLDVAVTPGACSDGMSDRTYPFTATVTLGTVQHNGCAWREGEDELGEA
ncbi:hypothetical protein [Erythrobacter alti]|uniref:COG3650 family protein n=1 Tax=Erythrobacter alti TaxID=1896145 RepID=UPI0030F419E6